MAVDYFPRSCQSEKCGPYWVKRFNFSLSLLVFTLYFIIPRTGSSAQLTENRTTLDLQATFHLTIFMRWQRAMGKILRNNYHHGSCGPSSTGKTSSVSLIFTQGMHRNVENR